MPQQTTQPSVPPAWGDYILAGNTVADWLVALGVSLGVLLALLILRKWVLLRIGAVARRISRGLGEFYTRIAGNFRLSTIVVIAVYVGSQRLALGGAERWLVWVIALALGYQALVWGRQALDFGIAAAVDRRRTPEGVPEPAFATTMSAVRLLGLIILYAVVLLLVLSNMGIDVTAMIAGLGVGGIAIALAVQNILGDLFASLSIVLDKPFVVGDFIIVGDQMGTVERIGLKTTRVKSLSGEQLVFSNSDLLGSRIRNFKRMAERRVTFSLGVVYSTPTEKIEMIVGIIREAVLANQPRVRLDRCHFQKFGPFSLDFECIYFILSAEYNVFMDIQQAVNLAVLRRFREVGIEFAFPTQTIHVERPGGEPPTPPTATPPPPARPAAV